MTYFVTITSQGQLSIPAKVRRRIGFGKTNKAMLRVLDDRIEISPATDILSLKGIFKTNKKISFKKTRSDFETALATGKV